MPTVVVLDTSLSMMRLCQPPPNGSEANGSGASEPAGHTHLDVAKHGIDVLLQHLVSALNSISNLLNTNRFGSSTDMSCYLSDSMPTKLGC